MFLSEWGDISSSPCFAGKITWWQIAARCCWNCARPWHASEIVSFLVGLRTYQHRSISKTAGYAVIQCHRFNIHKLYVLPTQLYLCLLCGSQNKQRLFPYTVLTDWFVWLRRSVFTARYGLGVYNPDGECLLRGTDWVFICSSD